MKQALSILRKAQLMVSVSLFAFVFAVCYKTTGFKLTEIPLSKWGITEGVDWAWNLTLVILGLSCYFNIYQYLYHHPHLHFKKPFVWIFLYQCLSISLIGIFVSGYLLHGILAYTYFFTLPLTIFSLAAFNRERLTLKEWLFHTVISVLMIVLPLSALFTFTGKAIAETSHSILFLIWNVYILKENFE